MCVIRTRHGPGRLLSTYLRSHLRGILIHSRAHPIGRRVGTQFSITDWNGKRFLVDCLQYSNLEFYCDRLSAIPPHCPVDYGLSAQFPPPHPNLSFFRFPLAQQFPPAGKTFFTQRSPRISCREDISSQEVHSRHKVTVWARLSLPAGRASMLVLEGDSHIDQALKYISGRGMHRSKILNPRR